MKLHDHYHGTPNKNPQVDVLGSELVQRMSSLVEISVSLSWKDYKTLTQASQTQVEGIIKPGWNWHRCRFNFEVLSLNQNQQWSMTNKSRQKITGVLLFTSRSTIMQKYIKYTLNKEPQLQFQSRQNINKP